MTTNQNTDELQQEQGAEAATPGQPQLTEEELQQMIAALYQHGELALKSFYQDEYEVDGQVVNHPMYGPLFTYRLLDANKNPHSVGFFMNELVHNFQKNEDPALWMSSFFVDILRGERSRLLPPPPQNEDEAKYLFDQIIVPHCAKMCRAEFEDEPVHVDIDIHPDHGPVVEAGFPSIREGNNVVAMPFHYLLALHLLNRDTADPLITGLYKIREEHGLDA
ncbi:hypothetical protein HGI30_07795 [Paenibacillus albicereus]|uniref:Uncharacterized protein n=1 Tax=Paenibacillus albicereus TaxID=2726185 RepID=A0A6H2GVL9_9BACL|nr:hypothetical protein [Paenibacillus albicereus]QJC51460.1 hypothetical protein HGI30_07795 [Paenibacillus albicereus]